jgi:DNA-binding NtrC family response regulator
MPGMTGLDILKTVKQLDPGIEVILMTAHASAQTAVEAMKQGAYDYLIKPFKMIELQTIVSRIIRTRELILQNRELKQQLSALAGSGMVFGTSPLMARIRTLLGMISDNDASILIQGESGTGKSLLAREIHATSARSELPFLTIECAAIPATLLESELFGYEKGAFTGADRAKPGKLLRANGGTLFLDEIGDMPLELQAKLLRVLQEREVTPLGSSRAISFAARIIAATNHDLAQLIKSGKFREDLYYRLNVIPVILPPLREHPEDLPELAASLVEKICARHNRPAAVLTENTLRQLQEHSWPGNIRELENILERTLVFNRADTIDSLLMPETGQPRGGDIPLPAHLGALWNDALGRCDGDREKAAALLGIDRPRLEKILDLSRPT